MYLGYCQPAMRQSEPSYRNLLRNLVNNRVNGKRGAPIVKEGLVEVGKVMEICISVQEIWEWVNGHIQEILIFDSHFCS
jgi:hypothetical protein